MDADNAVVKLCAAGMEAEGEGRFDEAKALFWQAWGISQDDFEACIAAHYVARHQDRPEDTLRWNQEALRRAHGNKSQAARLLGLSRNALRYRLSKIGIADEGDKAE